MASLYKINEGRMAVGCRPLAPDEPFALALAGMLYQTLAIGICGTLGLERVGELESLQHDLNQALDTHYATKP
jgi:hypothetical protein